MKRMSRREFVAATGAAAMPFAARLEAMRNAAVTAQEIVDRIKQHVGVEWKSETVDTFKAGDPATTVKGIVTTSLATMEVLRKAAKSGANLVITCEPTFYGRADRPTPPAGRGSAPPASNDPVFTAKNDYITRQQLVVWRFSDHWRLRKPDPLAQGLTDVLGWSGYRTAENPARLSIPAVTLGGLAADLKARLNARGGIRVVGDPGTSVQRVGILPGSTPIQASLGMLPEVDAIIAGEVREWEAVEYARDAVTAGQRKGLILLGRILSEEPGMHVCAQWLTTFVPEVPVTWIAAGDPYWRPM